MHLSEAVRSLKPSATIAAATKAKELKQQGVKVYEFTLGEPDFNTPQHIRDAALEAMNAGHTHYTPSAGILQLRQAICDTYERDYGVSYKPNQVVVSNGAKHSIHNVLSALCGPGDEVIIPTPYWVSYSALVELTGAVPVLVETTEESGFCLSPEQFEAAITDKTRLLMLNNPCNPTGAAYPVSTLEGLARVAVKHQIPVLSDEIYEKLVYGDAKHDSIGSLSKDLHELTITVNGFSKCYSMTGWRLGYTAAPKPLADAIDKIQNHTVSNANTFSQYGALAALQGDQSFIEDLRGEYDVKRQFVFQRLRAIPNIRVVEPQGAFYFFVYTGQTGLKSMNLCDKLLSRYKVATVPGVAFGYDEGIRLSYCTTLDVLNEGLTRFEQFCREH